MGLISLGKDAAGQDALIIGGHAVPVSLLGVGAAGVGALLVLRARSSGANVVSAGTPVTSTTATGDNADLASVSDAVSELSSELSTLQSQVGSLTTPPASPIPPANPTNPKPPSPPTLPTTPGKITAGGPGGNGPLPAPGSTWSGSAAGLGAVSPKPQQKATPVSVAAGIKAAGVAISKAVSQPNLNPKPSPAKTPAQTTQIVHSIPVAEKDASMAAAPHSPAVPAPTTSLQKLFLAKG